MKSRAVRTELLTGKTRSTDVNKIWRISIDHGLFVNFFRFKTWKIPIELQTMWLKELNFFDLSGIRTVGMAGFGLGLGLREGRVGSSQET